MLVENLSPGSAAARAARGHDWQDAEYLIADLLDAVRAHIAVAIQVGGGKARIPKPIPRPEQQIADAERRQKTADQVVAYLESYRASKGA